MVDPVRVILRVTAPEDQEIEFLKIEGDLEDFEEIREDDLKPRLVDGGLLHERTVDLDAFLPGEYEIPAIEVAYGVGDDRMTIATDPFKVTIKSVIAVDEGQPELADISDPVAVPMPMWWWVGGGLALVAIAAGLYHWNRERKRRAAMMSAAPPPEPNTIALRELEELLSRGLISAGDSKLFYLLLSDILRQYIERRFGLHAPERTTEEFLAELRDSVDFEPNHKSMLADFLSLSDMVKFAEVEPTEQDVDASVQACRRFIFETKPEPALITETTAYWQRPG